MRAPQDTPAGRWVMTFAADSRPGDLIRTSGRQDARRLVSRTYPERCLTFQATWPGGVVESVAKTRVIEIWDPPDGSVMQRVQTLSVEAI